MLSSKRKRKKENDVSDIRKYLKKEKLDVVLQIEDDQEDNQSSRNMFASNVMTNDRLTVMPTTRKKTRFAKKLSSQEYSKKMLESVPYQESSNFIQNEIEVSENRLCLEERKVREAMPKKEEKSERKAKVRKNSVKDYSNQQLTPRKISKQGGSSRKMPKSQEQNQKNVKNHSENV